MLKTFRRTFIVKSQLNRVDNETGDFGLLAICPKKRTYITIAPREELVSIGPERLSVSVPTGRKTSAQASLPK